MHITERGVLRRFGFVLLAITGLFALATATGTANAEVPATSTRVATQVTPSLAKTIHPDVSCNWSWSNPDAGTGRVGGSDAYMHTGPYASCPETLLLGAYTGLWWHCSVKNAYGNTWVHARLKGSDYQGWIYIDDIINSNNYDHPSVKPCS